MRILLADDHNLIREGFKPFLEELADHVEVAEAGTLDEALARLDGASRPDLVVLDLDMPGMDGTEGIRRMRAAVPGVPVVILTGSLTRDDVLAADHAGAAGYLPKTMSGASLVSALRLVLNGEKYLPPIAFAEARPAPAVSGAAAALRHLTPRETEILSLLAEGKTNKEIARDLGLQEITVKLHLKKIFRKLAVSNRTKAAMVALQCGFGKPA